MSQNYLFVAPRSFQGNFDALAARTPEQNRFPAEPKNEAAVATNRLTWAVLVDSKQGPMAIDGLQLSIREGNWFLSPGEVTLAHPLFKDGQVGLRADHWMWSALEDTDAALPWEYDAAFVPGDGNLTDKAVRDIKTETPFLPLNEVMSRYRTYDFPNVVAKMATWVDLENLKIPVTAALRAYCTQRRIPVLPDTLEQIVPMLISSGLAHPEESTFRYRIPTEDPAIFKLPEITWQPAVKGSKRAVGTCSVGECNLITDLKTRYRNVNSTLCEALI